MPGVVVVGAQWGDEGKGKAADQLGDRVDPCVCYLGGSNAGYILVVGGETFVMHLLPSETLNPDATTAIGNSVVVDLDVSVEELRTLVSRGVEAPHPLVSANAHIITEYHKMLDKVTERFLGKRRIGTTGCSVGPTYSDKVNRMGVHIQDIFDESILRQKVETALDQKNQLSVKVYNRRPIEADAIVEVLLMHAENIRPYVINSGRFINDALDRGEVVLLEGAQIHRLDVDHGTYPYVVSSNPTVVDVCTGAGVGPIRTDRAISTAKVYTIRIGEGPSPIELHDEDGDRLRRDGGESGATMGRLCCCGWFDALVVEQAVKINGSTDVLLTKLGVLSGRERIPVCMAYDVDGTRHDVMSATQSDFHYTIPVYEKLPGWSEDISARRDFGELPVNCRAHVKHLEELIGCRISGIEVGPGREQTIIVSDLL